MSATTAFSCLPYAQATPAQRQQALGSARQVLDVAYPHLSPAQWAAALDHVQPPLLGQAGQVLLAHTGLAALVRHLAAPIPAEASIPSAAAVVFAGPARGAGPASLKQTYAIPLDVREQLARVSYWRRVPVNQLVVHALTRLLADYPDEAARPLPPPATLP